MVISTNGGLHRYVLGDLVRFTSTFPFRIQITGRTRSFLNLAGEELMVGDAEKALAKTSRQFGVNIRNWTACATKSDADSPSVGQHTWILEASPAASSLPESRLFATALDRNLRKLNSDYDAKRTSDLVLLTPDLTWVSQGTFEKVLREKGKLGGQHKVPRLSMSDEWMKLVQDANTPSEGVNSALAPL